MCKTGGPVMERESSFVDRFNLRYPSGPQVELPGGTWFMSWNSQERDGSQDYMMAFKATGLDEAT